MIVNNLADCVKQIFMGLLEQPNEQEPEKMLREKKNNSTKRTNRNGNEWQDKNKNQNEEEEEETKKNTHITTTNMNTTVAKATLKPCR